MVGRQMLPFCLMVPFWLLVAYCGWRRTLAIWPAVLLVGVVFGGTQFLISNLHGPWLAAIGSALVTLVVLVGFLRIWKPREVMHVNEAPLAKGDERVPTTDAAHVTAHEDAVVTDAGPVSAAAMRKAWMPWLILTVIVFLWGVPAVKAALDGIFKLAVHVPGLDMMIMRVPPVVATGSSRAGDLQLQPALGDGLRDPAGGRAQRFPARAQSRWDRAAAMAGRL